ncbi:hypothetical protein CXG81DRAFT_16514 [Caulochytrium protostelioides]|uniref:Uncharacterized protein n=1 Tax=Caulochytrium protostelioides TaxID=1555241 RepID=A0A4P9XEW3_9FUNG|nr:hypothetical protein CXG81DRAFT_16514 [Caulochytrium protostelioides]|eukprot:RKP04094.1 hypothetical protein CXG81DRAFT_16514 [Caulochytrium protostelioides]
MTRFWQKNREKDTSTRWNAISADVIRLAQSVFAKEPIPFLTFCDEMIVQKSSGLLYQQLATNIGATVFRTHRIRSFIGGVTRDEPQEYDASDTGTDTESASVSPDERSKLPSFASDDHPDPDPDFDPVDADEDEHLRVAAMAELDSTRILSDLLEMSEMIKPALDVIIQQQMYLNWQRMFGKMRLLLSQPGFGETVIPDKANEWDAKTRMRCFITTASKIQQIPFIDPEIALVITIQEMATDLTDLTDLTHDGSTSLSATLGEWTKRSVNDVEVLYKQAVKRFETFVEKKLARDEPSPSIDSFVFQTATTAIDIGRIKDLNSHLNPALQTTAKRISTPADLLNYARTLDWVTNLARSSR